MGYCNGFYPTHQNQLSAYWGGPYGSTNCTANAGGMVGEAHTCGATRLSGATIRAATNEPIPDPRSPGLNLGQVDTALYRLTGGAIDLDTHYRYDWTALQRRIVDGAQAILQIQRKVMVDRGYAKGNLFGGGHAVAIGYDGAPWFDDPLTGRFPVDWETLKRAAGALILGSSGEICGYGKAYVSFSRDITSEWRVSVQPNRGDTIRRFGLYVVKGTEVQSSSVARTGGFSAKCSPPRLYTYPRHTSQRLVVITSGFLVDRAKAKGVIYAVRDDHAEEV